MSWLESCVTGCDVFMHYSECYAVFHGYSWVLVMLSYDQALSHHYSWHHMTFFLRRPLQMLSGRFTELMSRWKVWVFFVCMASPQCWQSDRLSINDRHLWNVCVQHVFITESFQIYGDVDWGLFDSPWHKHHPSLLWVCQPFKPLRFVNQQYRIASEVIQNAKAHAK